MGCVKIGTVLALILVFSAGCVKKTGTAQSDTDLAAPKPSLSETDRQFGVLVTGIRTAMRIAEVRVPQVHRAGNIWGIAIKRQNTSQNLGQLYFKSERNFSAQGPDIIMELYDEEEIVSLYLTDRRSLQVAFATHAGVSSSSATKIIELLFQMSRESGQQELSDLAQSLKNLADFYAGTLKQETRGMTFAHYAGMDPRGRGCQIRAVFDKDGELIRVTGGFTDHTSRFSSQFYLLGLFKVISGCHDIVFEAHHKNGLVPAAGVGSGGLIFRKQKIEVDAQGNTSGYDFKQEGYIGLITGGECSITRLKLCRDQVHLKQVSLGAYGATFAGFLGYFEKKNFEIDCRNLKVERFYSMP